MIKPQHLQPGDTVMTVSSSRGGPGTIPHRYKVGKQQLIDALGVNVVEGNYTLSPSKFVSEHPEIRARFDGCFSQSSH